jgi:sortase (surface protein transpeptidase)
MKKILLAFIFVILAGIGIGAGLFVAQKQYLQHPVNLDRNSQRPLTHEFTTSEANIAIPQTLSIPKLNVDASIEQVGKDSVGRMDVPKNWNNTGWYMYGPKPGEIGNAAIAGHVDDPTGKPSVFAKLSLLTPGDTLSVTDQNGNTYTFSVINTENVELSQFPGNKVFGSTDEKHLNLITCGGIWDREKKEYTQQTIVYTKLVTPTLHNPIH